MKSFELVYFLGDRPSKIFFGLKKRDLNGMFSVRPIYFYLISHGLPLAFDRRRKFVPNGIMCPLVSQICVD